MLLLPIRGSGQQYRAVVNLERAADIASEGFFDDPVMRWVFADEKDRPDALRTSFGALAGRFIRRGGRVDLDGDACVAMWLPPDPPDDPGGPPLSKDALRHFTPVVVERFTALGEAMDAAHPAAPHWYLGVVATRPVHQGRGLGARLIGRVLDLCDAEGIPAYLESSNSRNLPFYYRLGFVETGELTVPGGPTLFPMWREPKDTSSGPAA